MLAYLECYDNYLLIWHSLNVLSDLDMHFFLMLMVQVFDVMDYSEASETDLMLCLLLGVLRKLKNDLCQHYRFKVAGSCSSKTAASIPHSPFIPQICLCICVRHHK